jgi:two-component system phosphate regulon sensor histidine kinase PhoR
VFWRFFSLISLLAFGAALGFFWGGSKIAISAWASLLGGSLLAGLFWWVLDALRGFRVVSWLRQGDLNSAPQTIGLWGEVVDRTRRLLRDRERALVVSDQRLKDFLLAIQASPNGVMLLDDQSQIEWCNQTAAKQLGINIQRDLMQRIGNLVRDPVFTAYMNASETSDAVVIAGRDDREGHPVRISLQRHRYGEGKQLLITRDVTALEQAEAMRRDFVANVSHEIRTPLTVLSGFVETLQSLPLSPDEQHRFLGLMATQAHRMQSLVEDLLTLSRLEGSPSPGYQASLALSELMHVCQQEAHALSSLLDGLDEPQSVTFSIDPSLSFAVLLGEARELQSALSNLVSNAVRYTPAGGRIEVTAQSLPDGSLQLKIQDTGPGIAAEHLPRLTERFYRVDRSRSRESGGTGLGLAIVKHVMQRHQGQLSIHSVIGQGSCFTLTLPPARWHEHSLRDAC